MTDSGAGVEMGMKRPSSTDEAVARAAEERQSPAGLVSPQQAPDDESLPERTQVLLDPSCPSESPPRDKLRRFPTTLNA